MSFVLSCLVRRVVDKYNLVVLRSGGLYLLFFGFSGNLAYGGIWILDGGTTALSEVD